MRMRCKFYIYLLLFVEAASQKVCSPSCNSAQIDVPPNWIETTCQNLSDEVWGGNCGCLSCLFDNGTYSIPRCMNLPQPNCNWTQFMEFPTKGDLEWPVCGTYEISQFSSKLLLSGTRIGSEWTTSTCTQWSSSLNVLYGASYSAKLCVFNWMEGGFSVSWNDTLPSPNCGWSNDKILNPQNISNPEYKVCFAIGNIAGSSITAPLLWTVDDCAAYVKSLNAVNVALGCIFSDSFSIGQIGGQIPEPNCGWEIPL